MPSARKRRAELTPPPPVPGSGGGLSFLPPKNTATASPSVPSGPVTIQQAITITTSRLANLERTVNDLAKNQHSKSASSVDSSPSTAAMEELYGRFDILVNELADLKDNFTKLQSYTMEVNRMLLEDKLRNLKGVSDSAEIEYPSFLNSQSIEETNQEEKQSNMAIENVTESNASESEVSIPVINPAVPPISRRRGGGRSMDVRA